MQAAPSPQQTSVRVENVTSLKGLIQEIESQTSYRISYQGNLADNVPVKIAKSTKSVSQLLDEALRGTGITYIIRQNNIILTRAEAQSPASAAPAPAAPRKQHIAGQVLDAATRQPIIGATIWIKDSALGTSTASDGSFDYSFSGNFGFVTVSYVGYQTQEFPIGRIPKVISLSPDNNLEEVVVVGYGAQKKASIIGSIASVPVNDIKMPTGKISNNLAGQLAGVISVQRWANRAPRRPSGSAASAPSARTSRRWCWSTASSATSTWWTSRTSRSSRSSRTPRRPPSTAYAAPTASCWSPPAEAS